MKYTDEEIIGIMTPVARDEEELEQIRQLKINGELPFNQYWYIDAGGICRMLHDNVKFSNSIEGKPSPLSGVLR